LSLISLCIENFRNIKAATIECAPHFNLFFGNNATGKTSLLEAIYYLGTGKSFRTHQLENVIHYNQFLFTLSAESFQDNAHIIIGLQRTQAGQMTVRVNQKNIRSIAEISSQLPMQFISAESHRLLTDGPKLRRQFLDWGLFYTNTTFFPVWKQFQKILVQRNAALKSHASEQEMFVWNRQFSEISETLNNLRKQYITTLIPFFQKMVQVLLPEKIINLNYLSGWDDMQSLQNCLDSNLFKEYQASHTLYGPHRADLSLSVNNFSVENCLSQGQLKLCAYALKLAQGLHLQETTNKTPIFLIDDMPSELDNEKRHLITEILSQLDAQVFITGIEKTDLTEIYMLSEKNKMFHVEHTITGATLTTHHFQMQCE